MISLQDFTNNVLGKWGFELEDYIYISQGRARSMELQRQMDIRDGYDPKERFENE